MSRLFAVAHLIHMTRSTVMRLLSGVTIPGGGGHLHDNPGSLSHIPACPVSALASVNSLDGSSLLLFSFFHVLLCNQTHTQICQIKNFQCKNVKIFELYLTYIL